MKNRVIAGVLAFLLTGSIFAGVPTTAYAAGGAETEGTETETAADDAQESESEDADETIPQIPSEQVSDTKLTEVPEMPNGLTIGDFSVGGMTGEEAAEVVYDYVKEMSSKTATVELADRSLGIPLSDLGLEWSNEGAVADLLIDAAQGNLLSQYKAIKDIEQGEADTSIQFAVDDETASAALDSMLTELNVEPQNATCTRNADGSWSITPEVEGIVADPADAKTEIDKALEDWDGEDFTVEVASEVRSADITSDVYEGISSTPISSFSTVYVTGDANRNHNCELAASKMNGRWFMPGEQISMNSMIMPVTAAGGYLIGHSYSSGKVIDSIGGGICQVATTFYNTCLLLELNVVSRKNHSMSVTYVPLGRDATIFPESGLDLVVENSTSHALYLEAYTSGGNLVISFYGVDDRPANRTIQYRTVTVSEGPAPGVQNTEDMSLKPGTVIMDQDMHTPSVEELYKDVYVDGHLTESVFIHRDSYRGCTGIRRYGPAIDAAGNHYNINDQGYAVGADGTLYRLNPDGTFLDLPPANQAEEDAKKESEESKSDSESTESSAEESSSESESETAAE